MRRELALFGAALLALTVVLAGCSGGSSPTLPSPDGSSDRASSTITTDSDGGLLPGGLRASSFAVTLDGSPTTVRQVTPSSTSGASVCFVFDTTGSMSDTIEGVKSSIEAFAASLSGMTLYLSGIEYGDGTPADGTNTWDFFGASTARTLTQPSESLTTLQAWLSSLVAIGGGDAAENPLKALMEAKATMTWPSDLARHFIVLTDVGAHQRSDGATDPDADGRPDGQPFSPYEGSEVLAAFKGWGIIHAISPDYSSYWADAEGAKTTQANDSGVKPQAVAGWAGWDVRELADGGPAEYRTHNGTGGKWIEMPDDGDVDLAELGIADVIRQSYTVVYQVPEGMTSAHVIITVTYLDGGVSKTSTFDLGTVSFD